VVGIFIQVGIVDLVVHGMGHTDRLSYNIATIIGIGIGTIFRLLTYRKFVFHTPPAPTSAEQLEPESSGR
jgi:putative flippase GtrA